MFGTQSDEFLAKKAARGNHDAYEKLVSRYEKRIYNFGIRMTGSREDAMDLMQNTFISMYRGLATYREDAPFVSWLFAIASRRATDFYRARKPTEQLEDGDAYESNNESEQTPLDMLIQQNQKEVLAVALSSLPSEQRLVVELKFYQDLTFEEIAKLLDVSTNTLKSRLYGALRKIRTLREVSHAL